MKRLLELVGLALAALLAMSCSARRLPFAYTGRVETDPITISAQASGVIDALDVNAGDSVRSGELLGRINTDRLAAQRREQLAQLDELDARRNAAEAQIARAEAQVAQAKAQLSLAEETLQRTERLVGEGGATRQQRDEAVTQAQVGRATLQGTVANLAGLRSNIKLIAAQEDAARAAIELTDISIRDAKIASPIKGVVLEKFHYRGELVTIGTPLLEIADLEMLTVEIYVPLSALASIKIGAPATVTVVGMSGSFTGRVSWIASEAEFTPKTILTRETQTTLVYGVKIRVPNPAGALKIGMPVEVRL